MYNILLKGIKNLILPVEENYAFSVYWVYHIICKDNLTGKRNALMEKLNYYKIQTRESFWPINRQDAYKNQFIGKDFNCPVANFIGENGFYIPSGPDISDEEINRTVKAINLSIQDVIT